MAAPQRTDMAALQAAFVDGSTKEAKLTMVPALLKELERL
jgi:hypothetical protein